MRNFVLGPLARVAAARGLACLWSVVLAFSPAPLAAQDAAAMQRITGTVVGASSQPIPDVRVTVDGTRLGAMTGPDGRYAILDVAVGTWQVRAQRIGYAPMVRTVTVDAGRPSTADFSLAVAATMLSEVKVGYTTQERRTISDAVASVDADEIADQATATLEEKLRGRIPGVQVVANGEPGRPSQIIVRGQNFLGNPTPLYVVDGLYMRQNPNLNPEDVQTIDVLKDASASAQYGAQAANGVIVITTKRGRAGKPRISVNAYSGYQEIPTRVEMAGTAEWAAITRTALNNANNPSDSARARNLPTGVDTDWQDALFQRGTIQDVNISVAGGSDAASFLIAGGYLRQVGTIIRTGFDRYSVRVNSEGRAGRFTIGENLALSRATREGLNGFPLIDVVRMLPNIPVRDANGGYGFGTPNNRTFGTNPVGLQEVQDNEGISNQVIGTVYGEAQLFRDLRYRLNLGTNTEFWKGRNFRRQIQLRMDTPPDSSELVELRDNNVQLQMEHMLTYAHGFGAHAVNAAAVYTEQSGRFDRISAGRRGFVNPDLQTIDAGTIRIRNAGFDVNNSLRGLLLRTNYAFADRYLLTGSVRRDASSRFGPGNRYGTFGAVSAGWVLSAEDFFGSIPVLSNAASYFKLRASYGALGNQDIGEYQYEATVQQNLGYLFGNGVIVPGATQPSLANPDIRWQDNRQANYGFDMSLMNDRLSLTADYYISTSKGLLVRAPLPLSLGSASAPFVNAGSVRNTGFELGLKHQYESGPLRLGSTLALNSIRNRVLSLGNGAQPIYSGPFGGTSRTAPGDPIGSFYVRRFAGIFQNQAEVTAHCAQPNARPGDVRYADLNGDCRINNDDRYNAGSPIPKLEGGLGFDAAWGGFDMGLNLRGSYGSRIFNLVRFWTERTDEGSGLRAGLQPWTPENRSNSTPRAVWGGAGAANNVALVDKWIESGSFLRVQNLQFGYALPGYLTTRLGSGPARVYLNLQNLYTFTGYSGWDPEVLASGDPLARGVDDGFIYPNVRTISLGISLRQ